VFEAGDFECCPAVAGHAYARKAPTPVGVEPLSPDRSPDRVGAGTGRRRGYGVETLGTGGKWVIPTCGLTR